MRQKIRLFAAFCGLLCVVVFFLGIPKSGSNADHVQKVATSNLVAPYHFSLTKLLRQDGDLIPSPQVTIQSVSAPKVIYDPHPGGSSTSRSAPIHHPHPPTTVVTTTTTTVKSVTEDPAVQGGCLYHAMSVSQAHACWDSYIDAYPWDHSEAFKILYCESTGKSNAVNGSHIGLMQLEGGSTDPATNIHSAYYDFYLGGGHGFRGWEPWSCR